MSKFDLFVRAFDASGNKDPAGPDAAVAKED
jgi:hypothetical protein